MKSFSSDRFSEPSSSSKSSSRTRRPLPLYGVAQAIWSMPTPNSALYWASSRTSYCRARRTYTICLPSSRKSILSRCTRDRWVYGWNKADRQGHHVLGKLFGARIREHDAKLFPGDHTADWRQADGLLVLLYDPTGCKWPCCVSSGVITERFQR